MTPPKAKDTTKPRVVITTPSSNAAVSTSVTVKATVTDTGGIKHATVRVDGTPKGTLTTAPYNFIVKLAAGTHTIQVEAMDKAGNVGKTTVSVTAKNAPPAMPKPPAPTTPAPGGSGSGNTPAPKGTYGATCTQWDNCKSGMCAHDASLQKSYCTKTCAPSSSAPCPAGSTCLGSNGGAYVCAQDIPDASFSSSPSEMGAGCSISSQGVTRGTSSNAGPLTLLPLLLLLAAARRSRR